MQAAENPELVFMQLDTGKYDLFYKLRVAFYNEQGNSDLMTRIKEKHKTFCQCESWTVCTLWIIGWRGSDKWTATLHSQGTQSPSVVVKHEPSAGNMGRESQYPMHYVAYKAGVPQGFSK